MPAIPDEEMKLKLRNAEHVVRLMTERDIRLQSERGSSSDAFAGKVPASPYSTPK